jgi:hypothetical protein
MGLVNIFSPFYWKEKLEGHDYIKKEYVPLMLENYKEAPLASDDWNVHTSYNREHVLKHKIDWNIAFPYYKEYINRFLKEYLGEGYHDWEICGGLWYTAYGPGQCADIHEHVPDNFSIVHFIKFNPNEHWPITFINPASATTKYMLDLNPVLKDKINFNDSRHSLFHPRFTPHIEEGDLVIFPSHLEHMVPKTDSEEIRITIAFNIKIIS